MLTMTAAVAAAIALLAGAALAALADPTGRVRSSAPEDTGTAGHVGVAPCGTLVRAVHASGLEIS